MSNSSGIVAFLKRRDWRIWFGLVVTFFWIGGGIVFIATRDSNQAFTLEAIGSFLEGAFAPLAFLWLVLGLFIQQRELTRNTEALRLTVEETDPGDCRNGNERTPGNVFQDRRKRQAPVGRHFRDVVHVGSGPYW